MNRKDFLKTAAALPLAATAVSQVTPRERGPAVRPPNVLILMSDQHRPDLMTCAGNELVPTPNIDRIAARGVRFARAYCPLPVCAPSRMSFLTGQYPHTHGVTGNRQSLSWRTRTMAHHFRDHGYITGLIGKMHFLDAQTHGFDYKLGFNDWHNYLGPRVRHAANENHSNWICGPTLKCDGCGFPPIPDLYDQNPWLGEVQKMTRLASDLPAEDHVDAFVARESAKFMERYKDEPFFLVAGFLKPHAPYYPPKGWAEELYSPERMALREVGETSGYPRYIQKQIEAHQSRGAETLRFRRAGQLGCLAFLDHCVGQVYRKLEELGLAENTIVVYTSDHGEMDGDHGLYEKGVFFEPSVGVPLIISQPGKLPQGKTARGLAEYFALYPTLAELSGTANGPLKGVEARSFAAQVRDPLAAGSPSAFAEMGGRFMIRTPEFKFITNQGDIPELYDVEKDPGETRNLAADAKYKSVRDKLHQQLLAWHDPQNRPGALK